MKTLENFKHFIFDLDGTLINSAQDICHAANFARKKFQLDPLPLTEIKSFIGRGVVKLLKDIFKTEDEKIIQEGVAYFFSYYQEHWVDTTTLYPGVLEFLQSIQEWEGKRIFSVLTNKPQESTEKILRALEAHHWFSWILGGDTAPVKKPDPKGMFWLMDQSKVTAEETCFIGDSPIDRETGKNAGVFTILIDYGKDGFFSREDLEKTHPDLLIENLTDLLKAWVPT